MIQAEEIKLSKLHPNKGQIEGVPTNPRKAEKEQIEKLKKSIQDTPTMLELREIIAYDNNGELVIVGGNMRYRALKELGYKTALVKVLPADTPKDVINAFIIKDNSQFGEWDTELLAMDWDKDLLSDWGVDINWDTEEQPQEAKEIQEDGFSEEEAQQAPAIVKRGEVYQLGEHRLMCGDSTDIEQVKTLMGGGVEADLWLTDPPYNVSYVGKTKDALKIKNDSMEDENFRQFLLDAYKAADSVMKDGCPFYIWHADSEGLNFRYAAKQTEWKLAQCIVWNKNSLVVGRQDYQWKHEPCLYGWKNGAGHKWYGDRKQTTVINFDRPNRNDIHSTMKPVGLFGYLLNNSTKVGDVVLDSFGGSGTTLIACEELKRKAMLMELDERYCDAIIARWEKLTGKKAIKIKEA